MLQFGGPFVTYYREINFRLFCIQGGGIQVSLDEIKGKFFSFLIYIVFHKSKSHQLAAIAVLQQHLNITFGCQKCTESLKYQSKLSRTTPPLSEDLLKTPFALPKRTRTNERVQWGKKECTFTLDL